MKRSFAIVGCFIVEPNKLGVGSAADSVPDISFSGLTDLEVWLPKKLLDGAGEVAASGIFMFANGLPPVGANGFNGAAASCPAGLPNMLETGAAVAGVGCPKRLDGAAAPGVGCPKRLGACVCAGVAVCA